MPRVNTPKKAKAVAWLQVNFTNMVSPRPHHSPPVYGGVRAKAVPLMEQSDREQGGTHMERSSADSRESL